MQEARIETLERELAESQRSLVVTRAWFTCRLQRLREFANTLPEDKRQEYFRIVAEPEPTAGS